MREKIVVISPTRHEIEHFISDSAEVVISGIGMAEVAAATTRAIMQHSPSLIILAGIAGRYPHSRLASGDVALVGSEKVADLGAMREDGFTELFPKKYTCPYASLFEGFPIVEACTVSTAASPVVAVDGIDLENMEGAAFFAICRSAGVPFLELRAVSNTVSIHRDGWEMALATGNLAEALRKLLRLQISTNL